MVGVHSQYYRFFARASRRLSFPAVVSCASPFSFSSCSHPRPAVHMIHIQWRWTFRPMLESITTEMSTTHAIIQDGFHQHVVVMTHRTHAHAGCQTCDFQRGHMAPILSAQPFLPSHRSPQLQGRSCVRLRAPQQSQCHGAVCCLCGTRRLVRWPPKRPRPPCPERQRQALRRVSTTSRITTR